MASSPRSAPRAAVRIDGRSLRVGRKRIPLLSGAMHYWRLETSAWEPALRELRDMGLPMVETYVPWAVHERAKNEFDFGEHDPRKDLNLFLELAAKHELFVFLRPGPHINAELTEFGVPLRVLYDERCQARSPRHNPVVLPFPPRMFPVPSYASTRYHAEVGTWFDAVAEVAAPHLYPKGPIVLLQVDNEAGYYFRNGPYDQDYHPDALALWRTFLQERYGDLAHAARAHSARYATWDDVRPPERFTAHTAGELPWHLDWAAFQEHLLTHALARFQERMARAGLKSVPTIHNLSLGNGGLPVSLPAIAETVDVVGLDYYHSAREHRTLKRRTLMLDGTVPLAYAPELGVGAPPWFTPLAHEDSIFCALCALAYGLRGFNLYMAVDRDRWYGAPIDARGVPRVEAGIWKHLISKLHEHQFHELERRSEVALMVPHEYVRLSRATHVLGPLSPATLEAMGGSPVDGAREDPLGFEGPIQVIWWRMLAKFSDALTRQGVPYVYVAGDARADRFSRYRVIVSPSYEFVSPERWKHLAQAARDGAHVVYGPTMPTLDVAMRPHPFEVPRGGRKVLVDTPEDADAIVGRLVKDLRLSRPFAVHPAPLETTVHEDGNGPRLLFAINPGRQALEARVQLRAPTQLRDWFSDECYAGEREVMFPVSGRTCRVFELSESATALEVQSG